RARKRLPHQPRATRGRRAPAPRHDAIPMRVVMLSPEVHPYAKTGGLADVVAALPSALARSGVETTVCLPGYRVARRRAGSVGPGLRLHAPVSSRMEPAELVSVPGAPVRTLLVCADRYFDRDGLYGDA